MEKKKKKTKVFSKRYLKKNYTYSQEDNNIQSKL